MIVLALCAPTQMKSENPRSNIIPRSMRVDPVIRRRRSPPPFCSLGGAATTVVSVYEVSDISSCFCNLLGLKLSGCAVISKGIVVVEGEISCIRRCLKFMLRKKEKNSDSVKVIWQGRVAKPSFGKFSILHCTSEVAVRKFFSDHGASHYWDLAVKSRPMLVACPSRLNKHIRIVEIIESISAVARSERLFVDTITQSFISTIKSRS